MDDELTLAECRVDEESTLYVLLDLEGGGKKRKKKSYNTPKKNKHKHKKVKLAVLKYYKVGARALQRRQIRHCRFVRRSKTRARFVVYVVNVHRNSVVPVYSWLLIMTVIIVVNAV